MPAVRSRRPPAGAAVQDAARRTVATRARDVVRATESFVIRHDLQHKPLIGWLLRRLGPHCPELRRARGRIQGTPEPLARSTRPGRAYPWARRISLPPPACKAGALPPNDTPRSTPRG